MAFLIRTNSKGVDFQLKTSSIILILIGSLMYIQTNNHTFRIRMNFKLRSEYCNLVSVPYNIFMFECFCCLAYHIFLICPQEERMVPPSGHRDWVSHRHPRRFLSHAWRHVLLSSYLPRYDVIKSGTRTL